MLPGLLISIIALAAVLYLADIDQFLIALRQANYFLVAIGFILSLVWLLVRAQAWRSLLRNQAHFSQVFFTVNEGYLLNNLLPFRLGEIGRAFLLSSKAGLGFWEVFSSILIERVIDLGFAAGLVLVTLTLVVGASWAYEAAIVVAVLVLIGFMLLYLLARNRSWAINTFRNLSDKFPLLNRFGGTRVEAFFDGLSVLTEGNHFAIAILWIGLDWFIAIIQYYILLVAFIPGAEMLWAAFTLGVAALGIAAPSSPGGIGVFELSVIGALAVFGVEASKSFAYAITTHLIQISMTGILGAIGFLRDGESLIETYRRSRQISKNSERAD